MPLELKKAYINCYMSALDDKDAITKAFNKLHADGMQLQDIVDSFVYHMEIDQWDIHIKEQYPGLYDQLPDQKTLEKRINRGEVVYRIFN